MSTQTVAPPVRPLEMELEFTDVYRQHEHEHVAIREAHCLRVMYPKVLGEIREADLLAGRVNYGAVGFGLEISNGGVGYDCQFGRILKRADECSDPVYSARLREMAEFWKSRTTTARHDAMLSPELKRTVSNNIASGGPRLAGTLLDFDKLVRLGIPGLRDQINAHRQLAAQSGGDVKLYDAMQMALELLADVCRFYARQARTQAQGHQSPIRRQELCEMAEVLDYVAEHKPATFRQSMQLFWIYAIISSSINYGRMDVYLGDLYTHDIDQGILTAQEALALTQSLWQLIADRKIIFNSRVTIGGMGRRNEANADRFALLAMEATRTVIEIEPQLTLRFHQGQDPRLMSKALDVIGEGRIYPMLYNDDVNVPAVGHAFGVSLVEAQNYLPYGCGEYALDGISFGSPNCALNLLKALEVTLHNGVDAMTRRPLGLALGEFCNMQTFDDLWLAYCKQVEHHVEALAQRHAIEYQAEREAAAFLFASILYDDCIKRGRSLVDGGVRYAGGVVESFSIVNVGDSLNAIRQLVYEKRLMTQEQLMAALKANFQGYEREHRLLLAIPKFGNDDPQADAMVRQVSEHIATTTRNQAEKIGLDYFLVVNINNFANVSFGQQSGASADGRRNGEPVANANTPTAGNDRSGITAMLNSLAKISAENHAGYVQNMKVGRPMFSPQNRPKLEALLNTYWANGGTQAMITAINKGDLEQAMEHPEHYPNLIVRVGGFSARFVELQREVQLDILKRTLH
jgi:pyruvate-formate lyase